MPSPVGLPPEIEAARTSWAGEAVNLACMDLRGIQELHQKMLGRKGEISQLSRLLGAAPVEARPLWGQAIQELRSIVESALDQARSAREAQALALRLENERIDPTLEGFRARPGTLHPVAALRDRLLDLFLGMGFEVADAPEVDTEWFNFTALNVPDDHPARDMQDTFYLDPDAGDGLVLRTHTSNYQPHALLDRKPPFRLLHCGPVYRCDSDATHAPMFHQIEGLVVDTDISFAHLKATLYAMAHSLFGERAVLRFRPSFFPFTEPSAEMDVDCQSAGLDRQGWMEIGGCGMVHPRVLEQGGVDPEQWQGFAFGFGLERMAMLGHGITDIALLSSGDQRFLRGLRGLR